MSISAAFLGLPRTDSWKPCSRRIEGSPKRFDHRCYGANLDLTREQKGFGMERGQDVIQMVEE